MKKLLDAGPATHAETERLVPDGRRPEGLLGFLQEHFGKWGGWYYRIARGIDEPPVEPDRV